MAAEPERAAGIIARSPSGRVLLCRRTDGQGWCWPGGHLKDGESIERCAAREFFEETGRRISVGRLLMRSAKHGVDFSTFITDVDDEFVPRLNHEHSAFMWADPLEVLEEASER